MEASGDALEAGGTAAAVAEGCRVSPEFTQAADLIDSVSPWECGGDWVYNVHTYNMEGKKEDEYEYAKKKDGIEGGGRDKKNRELGAKGEFSKKESRKGHRRVRKEEERDK